MSKPLPEQSNFIAIGAWNPAIIQPYWLRKHFPEKIPDNCNIEIASAGATSSIRMNYEKIIIDPNNGRLILIPKEFNEETMAYIAELALGMYKLLEHTPVGAAGCNFVFKLDPEEIFTVDEIENDDKITSLYNGLCNGTLVSKLIRHTFGLADCSVNVIYDYIGTERILRLNFDYQKANSMENASKSFVSNFKYSIELLNKLIRKK